MSTDEWRIGLRRGSWALLVSLVCLLPDSVSAQAPSAPAAPGPVATPVQTGVSGRYPLPPGPFQRGNAPIPRPDNIKSSGGGLPAVGLYFPIWKMVLLVAGFAFWIHYTNWVHVDSRGLKVRPEFWNSLMLVGGVLAFLAFFGLPMFAVSLAGWAFLIGGPLGAYVWERNHVVPENRRVMTPAHLDNWAQRQLAKVGINLNRKEVVSGGSGPPINFVGKSRTGKRDDTRSQQVESSKGFIAAKELIYDAVQRRATDIHLEPKDDQLAVRLRIDGVMYPAEPFEKSLGDAIVNIVKVLCAMDITEKRRSQDGSFGASLEGRDIDFRVATQGTRDGEKLSLRILDQSNSVSKLEQLGMRKQLEQKLETIIQQPHGLLLVCGPTGAGKSTTLYACLNSLDVYEKNIITIEDPVEYKMSNVTQIEVNTKAGNTFGQSLRSVLRQDPDVVMVGEIRDEETAKIACQAANTGHMVFSTIHANDSITALYRLLDLGVEPFMVSTAVSAILAQRLARRLCPQCRQQFKPKSELLKALGLPPEKVQVVYRPLPEGENDCPHCAGLGFYGRIGVYELLTVSERMRDMIRSQEAMSAIRNEARKEGMLYMQEEALRLVVRGVTSFDEVRRVVK